MKIAAWLLLFCSAVLVYLFLSVLFYQPKEKDRPEKNDALQDLVDEINSGNSGIKQQEKYDPEVYEEREESIKSCINACWPELLPELSFSRNDDQLTISWLSPGPDALSFCFRKTQHMQLFANSIAQKKNITLEPFRVMIPLHVNTPDPEHFFIGDEEGLQKYRNSYEAFIHTGYGARCLISGDSHYLRHVSLKPVLSATVINIMKQSMLLPEMIEREIRFHSFFPDKLFRDYFYFLPEARDIFTPCIKDGFLYAIDAECLEKAKKQLLKQARKGKENVSFGKTETIPLNEKIYNRMAQAIHQSMNVRCVLPKMDLSKDRIEFSPFVDQHCISTSASMLFYQHLLSKN